MIYILTFVCTLAGLAFSLGAVIRVYKQAGVVAAWLYILVVVLLAWAFSVALLTSLNLV